MKRLELMIFVLFLASNYAEEIEIRKTVKKAGAVEWKNNIKPKTNETEVEDTPATFSTTDEPFKSNASLEVITNSPDALIFSTSATTITNSAESTESESPDDSEETSPDFTNNILPTSDIPRRKVIYVNQQQSGKLNVHLELNDVSVIVIPNHRDPQLSLLNLLFKSAQKSNRIRGMVKKAGHDEYSKYQQANPHPDEDYRFGSTRMPSIESRAPYKVDISSTMGQQSQPAVEIIANAHPVLRTPQHEISAQSIDSQVMQLLKPTQAVPLIIKTASDRKPQSNRIFKRSIDTQELRIDDDIPDDVLNYHDDELTESGFNSLDSDDENLAFVNNREDSGFVLLGAVENCGPGRKRNSYQICVAVEDMK